jgi:hypothetical protein
MRGELTTFSLQWCRLSACSSQRRGVFVFPTIYERTWPYRRSELLHGLDRAFLRSRAVVEIEMAPLGSDQHARIDDRLFAILTRITGPAIRSSTTARYSSSGFGNERLLRSFYCSRVNDYRLGSWAVMDEIHSALLVCTGRDSYTPMSKAQTTEPPARGQRSQSLVWFGIPT